MVTQCPVCGRLVGYEVVEFADGPRMRFLRHLSAHDGFRMRECINSSQFFGVNVEVG